MGDHTETLEIDFDPTLLSFEEIVKLFWKSHNPNRANYRERQYISIFFYRNEQQKEALIKEKRRLEGMMKAEIQTEIVSFSRFYLAEMYHQKYYLKRYSDAVEKVDQLYKSEKEFMNSTLVARLNGFVKGYGKLADIKKEVEQWQLSEDARGKVLEVISSIKW